MSHRELIVAAIACLPRVAVAQPEPAPPPAADVPPAPPAPPVESTPTPTAPEPAVPEPAATVPTPAELADDVADLERRQRALEKAERRNAATREHVHGLLPLGRLFTVFVDVGAFAVGGDGSGIRSDVGHLYYPRYIDQVAGQWVFMGDPLATAINSLGEPADTASSRELAHDTINSAGRPSLIVNALGLAVGKDVGHGVELAALAELLPRPDDSVLAFELANVKYHPDHDLDLELAAGKIDAVLGIEYRDQDAPRRLGVTPSLICRYTCGRPVGVSARWVRGPVWAAAALTTGDNFQRLFEPAHELTSNGLPTGSAHVQWKLPIGEGLVLGASGALGPQQGQRERSVLQWHVGADVSLRGFHDFDITAEYVQGLQQGRTTTMTPCNAAACLRYKGAYVLVDHRTTARLTPYVRIDWRDAVHTKGTEFVYESHVMRGTIGARYAMTSSILGKLEYTWNHELDGIPQFADDVVTSSIVVTTD